MDSPEYKKVSRRAKRGLFNIAIELTNVVRELALVGIRRRHPDFSSEQVSQELARYIYRLNRSRKIEEFRGEFHPRDTEIDNDLDMSAVWRLERTIG